MKRNISQTYWPIGAASKNMFCFDDIRCRLPKALLFLSFFSFIIVIYYWHGIIHCTDKKMIGKKWRHNILLPTTSPAKHSFVFPFSKSDFLDTIQEIEWNVYFDKISNFISHEDDDGDNDNDNNTKNAYWTGTSPHYYDGPFSLQKTCKYMRFRYLCPAYIAHKTGFDQWSMFLHNIVNMSRKSQEIFSWITQFSSYYSDVNSDGVHRRQQQPFYTYDVYDKFNNDLRSNDVPAHIFRKPKLRILMYGNSHLKQIVDGLLCLITSVNDKAIKSITPRYRYSNNNNNNNTFLSRNYFCFDEDMNGIKEHNKRAVNGLHLNESMLSAIEETQFTQPGIASCDMDPIQLELADGTTIFYIYAHTQGSKSLYKEFSKFMDDGVFVDNDGRGNELDFIVFNVGNQPYYNFWENLSQDLRDLKHDNKPVIFLRTWYEVGFRFLRNTTLVNRLREKHPNLIYLPSFIRYQGIAKNVYRNMKESNSMYGHFCNPGMPEHYALNLIHLIDLLAEFSPELFAMGFK